VLGSERSSSPPFAFSLFPDPDAMIHRELKQKKECRERGGEITTGAGIQKGL
jgi:hypothetical protein